MADKDIKQRIVLEGEKEYNSALKEAQRNLKVLRSELKAESAELGKNATEQQKSEAKIKNLNKQIKEQEKVVRTYEKALAEVREKYGDNEEAISKWEIKLNDARTALANMKNSLDDTGRSMKSIGDSADMGVVAAHSLAESLAQVADTGGMISGALEEAFKSVVGTITDTISQVWESVVDLAARSNNIVDLAGFWNTDPTKIQQWANAVSFASGSLEDMTSLVTKINAGDAKKIAELTGVSDVNYKDRWEYAMAVMDSLSKMDTLKRNEAAFDIFGGKQATKAFDLLNDWNTVLQHLSDFDVENGGFGLSEEQLSTMSELYDKVNGLKASWQALKDMATVQLFGDLALDITGNFQNIVNAFKDYFNARDGFGKQQALDKIKENIKAIFERVKEAIEDGLKLLDELADELKNSDDSTLQVLGNLLDQIVGALEWFTNPSNWETVKKGFEAIIGIWATGKITSAIGHMASFGSHLATIGKFFGWGSGGGSTATTAAEATATATGGGFWSSAGALLKNVGSVGVFAAPLLLFADQLKNDLETMATWRSNALTEQAKYEALSGLYSGSGMFDIWDTLTKYVKLPDRQNNGMEEFAEHYVQWLDDQVSDPMLDNLADLMDQDTWEAFGESMRSILNGDLMYSDEERAAFIEPIRQVLDLIEQDLNEGGFDNGEIPAEWWTNQNNLTSEDISGFRVLPNNIASAVRNGVSNIRVTMDGQAVGRLVAPYVSEQIARDMV